MGFIRFDNGACLQIEFSWASNIECDQMFVELRGDKAGSRMSGIDRKFAVFTEECGTNVTINPSIDDYAGMPHHEGNIRHFIDVIEGKAEPDFTPEQGVNMVKILEAIYKSAELGHEIQL
jgi:predicted dehydrogenase